MSHLNTPSETPISDHMTPISISACPSNSLTSSISASPVSQPVQPTHPAEPVLHQPQAPQPATTAAPLLQHLPQGRPLDSKSDLPSPAAPWAQGPHEKDAWAEPASDTPVVHGLPPETQHQLQYGRSPPEAAYVRGGHLLGGYNPARYAGNPTAHPKFNAGGRVIVLTNASNLQAWVQQISYIARSLSCFDELTKRFTSFPQPGTVQLFICETRFATAFRVLEGSISGPVWAYMRVLGFSSLPESGQGLMSPTPADCFEYAKLAASRMAVPGTPEQPAEERTRMVQEVLTTQATDYPGERLYKKGIQWLRLACDNLIRQGDFELAKSLYEPLPEWAPRPLGYVEPATTNGEESPTEQYGHHATPAAETGHSPILNGSARTIGAKNPPKLVPEGHVSGKRKRTKKDVGSKSSKLVKPPVGADTVA